MGTIQNHATAGANPPSTMSENRRFASEAAMASIISFSLAMARSRFALCITYCPSSMKYFNSASAKTTSAISSLVSRAR